MNPTQAQIEAAANAMEQEMFAPHELPLDDELHGKYLHTAKAALTAAAGIGEQTKDDWLRRESDLIVQIERATIERCAQVVSDYLIKFQNYPVQHDEDDQFSGRAVAALMADLIAAIRALKDKP